MKEDIIELNIYKAISDKKLSKESKEFISDLVEAVLVKRFDKACIMLARLKADDSNQLDAMTSNLHRLLDLIGGY